MQLNQLLLQTLTELGITPEELEMLKGRMMFAVTTLQAQLSALDSQIDQLQQQREVILTELAQANTTVQKLISAE